MLQKSVQVNRKILATPRLCITNTCNQVSHVLDYFSFSCHAFNTILVVARGFPQCKPNRIPGKMPEDKMSENGKLDKMSDI